MRILVVARHGQYTYRDDDYHLSDQGRREVQALAELLRPMIEGLSVALLSSTAPRASESAKVLGEVLGLVTQEHEMLWSDNLHPTDVDGAVSLVQSSEADVVIVMTHQEYTELLPGAFVEDFSYEKTYYAEAWVVDCGSRTFSYLSNES